MLFSTNLRQKLKEELTSKAFVIILLLMTTLLLGIIKFSVKESSPLSLDIGIVLEGESPYLKPIGNSLVSLDLQEIHMKVLNGYSHDQLKELVAAERYEGIYIISDKLIDGIIKGKPKGAMTSYISPNFFMDKTMNAWIYSAVLIELSFEVSTTVTSEVLLVDKASIYPEMAKIYDYYEKNQLFVGLESSYYGEGAVPEKGSELIYTRAVHGIIALGVLLINWAMVPKSVELYQKTMVRLRKGNRRQLALSQFAVHLTTSLLLGLVLVSLLKVFAPTLLAPIMVEAVALLLYAMVISAVGNIIALLLRSDNLVFSSSLFSFLVFLFLGGTVIDPRELGTILGSVSKILPSSYYGESVVNARFLPLLPLAIGGIVLYGTIIIVGQKERKQK